jgi:beta-glucuronidase
VQLVRLAKSEPSGRPVTFSNIPEHCDEANRACDFLSVNEYAGWYYDIGKPLQELGAALSAKLEGVYASGSRFTYDLAEVYL